MEKSIMILVVALVALVVIGISVGISFAIANSSFATSESSAAFTSSDVALRSSIDSIKSDIVEMKKNTDLKLLEEMVKKLNDNLMVLKTQISTMKAYDRTLFEVLEKERVKVEEFAKRFPATEDNLKNTKDELDQILLSLKTNLLESFQLY